MKLLVVSTKECWAVGSGYVTLGGFPIQMRALAELFTGTRLAIVLLTSKPPPGANPLEGPGLTVQPLANPAGVGWSRKAALPLWLAVHLPRLWREIRHADAVHALVPGDIGSIGMIIAKLRRKPLFVRHCGTWGHHKTLADRALGWLLPRIAGGRTVVMATGGAETPPCPTNPGVTWIFATAVTRGEMARLPSARPWQQGQPLRLIQVGRLVPGKNVAATIRALAEIRRSYSACCLDVVGDGPSKHDLLSLVAELDLSEAVTFHGNVPHERVLDLLVGAQLFIFPTKVREGFPKAVVEAMASSVPVLAPRVSVLPQLLSEGGGLLLETVRPEAIARAVCELMADPRRHAEMASRARRTAERYSLENWQQEIRSQLELRWGPLGGEAP